MGIYNRLKYKLFLRKWCAINKDSATVPMRIVPFNQVIVGKHSYGSFDVYLFNDSNKLIIGNYVSIGPEVIFNVSADHHTETLSTYPFAAHILKAGKEGVSKGDIIIDDDVWIGSKAIILSGVHIGQGAVVAAGATVTKDVEPYSIVGGTPAKLIKKRFPADIINQMCKLDYSQLNDEMIKDHANVLYKEIGKMTLKEVIALYDWFPKKEMVDIDDKTP